MLTEKAMQSLSQNRHRVLLGVNIDHVATLRQARRTRYPDPVYAAQMAEQAGADGITVHLREDRRHIQADDVFRLKAALLTRLNLEMAVTSAMVDFALEVNPPHVCLVPEKREELTTEGGLDVAGQYNKVDAVCRQLMASGIEVSLFIDPDVVQIDAAKALGVPVVELHTGVYADSASREERERNLKQLYDQVAYTRQQGVLVNAGHGLNYHNVQAVAQIPGLNELNIGHSIVSEALFLGWFEAVKKMKALLR